MNDPDARAARALHMALAKTDRSRLGTALAREFERFQEQWLLLSDVERQRMHGAAQLIEHQRTQLVDNFDAQDDDHVERLRLGLQMAIDEVAAAMGTKATPTT